MAVPSVFSWTKTATPPSNRKKRAMEREERRDDVTPNMEIDESSKDDRPQELFNEEDILVSDFAEVTVEQNDDSHGQHVQNVQTDKVDLYDFNTDSI